MTLIIECECKENNVSYIPESKRTSKGMYISRAICKTCKSDCVFQE